MSDYYFYCNLYVTYVFWLSEHKAQEIMQSQVIQSSTKNTTNIVLVHGAWADGFHGSKVIPILKDAGHKVIAVQCLSFCG